MALYCMIYEYRMLLVIADIVKKSIDIIEELFVVDMPRLVRCALAFYFFDGV